MNSILNQMVSMGLKLDGTNTGQGIEPFDNYAVV